MYRFIIAVLCVAGLLAGFSRPASAQNVTVIVNEAAPATSLAMDEVGLIFQKQRVRWPNGLTLEPVDLTEGNTVREHFSRMVFTKSAAQMKAWWQTQIFSGKAVPPVELSTEAQVIEYVRSHAGAIAYVSPNAALGDGVRRLRVVR